MGFLDKVKTTVAGNPDKASSLIDQAARMASGRAGAKHRSKIEGAAVKAKDYVRKMDRGAPGEPGGPGTTGPASSPPPSGRT